MQLTSMDSRLKITAPASGIDSSGSQQSTLAYRGLVLFTVIYFFRPEDYIPGLHYIPLAKISGGIALLALIFGARREARPKLPLELKFLLLLLVQMLLTIPFAFWKGGSLNVVVNEFSKAVIVAMLVFFAVTTPKELRRLLYTQSALVALLTVATVLVHHIKAGRLQGIQKGFLENPNDLAMNIAINFPLCVAFLLGAKGIRKVLWGMALGFMVYAVVATYSRSGMVALSITGVICLWEFGIKGRRPFLLGSAVFVGMVVVGVMLVQPHYLQRLETLVKGGDVEESGDRGSLEARSRLLREAVSLTLAHPVFGVGPGNFQVVTNEWHVAHNTYAELGAETGLPGLLLFVLVLATSFRKLRKVRKLPGYATYAQIRLWTGALWAGLAAYTIGSLFASSEYNLFPYFIVGYICALYAIAAKAAEAPRAGLVDGKRSEREGSYDANGKGELAWSR